MSLQIAATNYGQVQGVSMEGYTVFKGIPFAAPPVGELRWRAPQPPASWEGILKADHFSAKSMQKTGGGGFYEKEFYDDPEYAQPGSEDSLYLNIWTPAERSEEKLPVAFWIHGGGYNHGSGGEKEFDGEAFCRRGVILVSINYRVNIFGFLAHPWLAEENPHHGAGNYGILDQIAALNWVYENIAAFGGDPEQITIFGQSAGAMSVQTLISSPLTGSRISKAILQSGGGYDNGLNEDRPLSEAMKLGARFVELTGAKTLKELRAMPAEELYEAYAILTEESMKQGLLLPMMPNIDGYVLTDGYNSLIEKGGIKKIPYLLGSTKNDILVDPKDVEQGIPSRLHTGCLSFARQLSRQEFPPIYVYRFDRQLPGDDAGAFHSSELWYMFGTMKRAWRPFTEEDKALSEEMLDCWTDFVKTGNPDPKQGDWKPCTEEDSFVKYFDV